MIKKITGTKDILPQDVSWWQRIEEISRHIFSIYNYHEIRLPLIEKADLFNRSLGESTEIVKKQMFLIRKDSDVYVLRPEATASVVRAYIENNLDKKTGLTKLYYIGPMFRLERPQKGRLRQFHHLGYEVIGSEDADLDIEVISLADSLIKGFSIDGYNIKINSLGCDKDKGLLTEILRKNLKYKLSKFCDDCRRRFNTNALRILDCKNKDCLKLIEELDIQHIHLCSECEVHFNKVKEGLDFLKINYEIVPRLVRGLDYYTRTVFEITHAKLGSQDALGAGGRYNDLVSQLGGPDVGAIGFAFGIERLFLVSTLQSPDTAQNLIYVVTLGNESKKQSLKLLDALRKNGITSDTDYENKSLKGALRRANALNARYVLIIGDDELKKNVVTLKDMVSGGQREIKQEDIVTELKNKCYVPIPVVN